jgi:hypothetical protein
MTFSVYSITQKLSQSNYEKILDFSLDISPKMLIVINKSISSSNACERILDRLNPYLLETKESSEWPGTILYGKTAIVKTYSYRKETLAIVKNITTSLYDWILPDLPEDFCLLRNDLTLWLVSISHEEDGYFYGTQNEINNLIDFIPDLAKMLKKDS